MPQRDHVDWVKKEPEEILLLVKRDVYNVYALMTPQDYRETEPYVEAIAAYVGNRVVALIRRDKGNVEMYFEANAGSTALFSCPVRRDVGE